MRLLCPCHESGLIKQNCCAAVSTLPPPQKQCTLELWLITFRMSRRRHEMYGGHLCLSVCLSAAACLHYCTVSGVTCASGRGCPLVVQCWADLQSGHRLRCYGNITRMQNDSEYMLALCLDPLVDKRVGGR